MNIILSEAAKEHLTKALEEKTDKKGVRIHISSYGWGGPTFGLVLDEPKEGEKTYEVEGFTFLVDEGLEERYGEFSIDYSSGWLRKGFIVVPQRGGGGSCR